MDNTVKGPVISAKRYNGKKVHRGMDLGGSHPDKAVQPVDKL